MTVQHADTHASLTGCGGRHVRPPAPGAEKLEWQPQYGVVRVLDHTCWRCSRVSYELCLLGGAYVIRKHDASKSVAKPVVSQTAPVHHRLAWEWWQMLLHGLTV